MIFYNNIAFNQKNVFLYSISVLKKTLCTLGFTLKYSCLHHKSYIMCVFGIAVVVVVVVVVWKK
jgi:hypothetical protein